MSSTSEISNGLHISISGYRKICTNYETYIVFEITTDSQRSQPTAQEFHVSRRFKEFVWLRSRLEVEFPMAILPPVPDKHPLTQLERFAGAFIDQRQVALQQFLRRLAKHPLASLSESFIAFLSADKEIFSRYQSDNAIPGNILTRLVSNISTAVSPLSTYPLDDVTINDQFYQIFKETESMYHVMSRMESVCEQLSNERGNLQKDVCELLACLNSWANQESLMDETFAAGLNGTNATSTILNLSAAWEKMNSSIEPVFVTDRLNLAPLFHEYALFASVIGQTLRKRCDVQQQLNTTRQQLVKVRQQLHQVNMEGGHRPYQDSDDISPTNEATRKPSLSTSATSFTKSVSNLWKKKQTPEELQESLKLKLDQLTAMESELQSRLNVYSEDFLTEYARWRSVKRHDIGNALKQLADAQIAYLTTTVEAWNNALQSISSNKTTPGTNTWSAVDSGRPSEGGSSWHSPLNPVPNDFM